MIRSAGSWSQLGIIVDIVMQSYKWRHIVLLAEELSNVSICSYGSSSIMQQMNLIDNYTAVYIQMSDNPADDDIDYYLDVVHMKSRGKYIMTLQ